MPVSLNKQYNNNNHLQGKQLLHLQTYFIYSVRRVIVKQCFLYQCKEVKSNRRKTTMFLSIGGSICQITPNVCNKLVYGHFLFVKTYRKNISKVGQNGARESKMATNEQNGTYYCLILLYFIVLIKKFVIIVI